MAFTDVRIARRKAGTSGISASCTAGDAAADRTVRISLTRDAQMRHFGGHADVGTDRFTIGRGTDADRGKLAIMRDPEGAIQASQGMHGSINFRLQAFPPVPPDKVKSTPCAVLESDKARSYVVIRIPWRDGSAAR